MYRGAERRKHTKQCRNCWKRHYDNTNAAYKGVCANKGEGGVDEVTVEELYFSLRLQAS